MESGRSGRLGVVSALLREPYDHIKDVYIEEALIYAVGAGHEAVVRELLLHRKISKNCKSRVVFNAAVHDRLGIVKALLNDDGPIDEGYKNSMMELVAKQGYKDVMDVLLDKCAPTEEIRGRAIQLALENRHENIVVAVLARGPIDKNFRETLFVQAAQLGYEISLNALLRNGEISKEIKGTATYLAAKNGRREILAMMLTEGLIDKNTKERALIKAAKHGHDSCVDLLLNNMTSIPKDVRGRAVCTAAQKRHVTVVSALLRNGPISREDASRALSEGSYDVVLLLSKYITERDFGEEKEVEERIGVALDDVAAARKATHRAERHKKVTKKSRCSIQ